ncbi:thioredoxin domain-containing protein [Bacillus mangrovi]|uniref:Thioredoxin domain-containing protein n=1 Tax=Metabacillus mangrovi TaxID=1491830 RepID=A0A7X2S583_9BACI|nr:thioredoxin domain-containing protein [Metabacillus mangrovi]MTH53632.1 thioredoxin domain-containing protein [Metabacillus mangrovi]
MKKDQNTFSQKPFVFGLLFAILLAMLIGGLYYGYNQSSMSKPGMITYEDQPYLGDKDAPVKIVEFGDYKCPACKRFNETLFKQIDKELIQTGKVQFYFFHHPFINVDSYRSADFAESVYLNLGNERFWEFHEKLYAAQPDNPEAETKDIFKKDYLINLLSTMATEEEVKQVVASYDNKEGKLEANEDDALSQKLGVTSTPTLFVNEKMFLGRNWEDLKTRVDQAAKETDQ